VPALLAWQTRLIVRAADRAGTGACPYGRKSAIHNMLTSIRARRWLASVSVEAWLFIPALALALALRLHDLVTAQRGIWIDEAFSIWVARQAIPKLVTVLQTVDTHPPLFYLLLHFWLLPRHDPYWVRLFPALTSTLTVGAAYLLGCTVAGRRCGLLSALLFALSPVLVQYGQDGRMYSLFVLLSVLSLWTLLRALEAGGGGRWAVFVVTTLALLYTYTEGVFIPAAEALYVLYLVRGAALRSAILALLIVGAGWSVWLPSILHQFGSINHRFWLPPPDLPRVINTLLTFAANVDEPTLAAGRGAGPLSPAGPWLLLPVGLLMLWGFLRLPALSRRERATIGISISTVQAGNEATSERSSEGDPQSRWLLLGAFLLPHLGALAVSRVSPVYLDRSLLDSLAGGLPLLAAGMLALPGPGLILPVAAIWCAFQWAGLDTYYRYATTEDWQGPARYVAAHARAGDLVLFSGSWLQLAFDYYYQGPPLQEHGLPVDLFSSGVLEPPEEAADIARLPALVGVAPRVWLIYGHQSFDDPQGMVPPALQQLFRQQSSTPYLGGITLYQFSTPVGGAPQVALDDRFQSIARLSGLTWQRTGTSLSVTLFWQVLGRSSTNLHMFVHVLRADGTVLAQHDGEPLGGTQHTSIWTPGARLADPYPITLPSGTGGPLRLEIGIYDIGTGQRLQATGPQVVGGDHVLVSVALPTAATSGSP